MEGELSQGSLFGIFGIFFKIKIFKPGLRRFQPKVPLALKFTQVHHSTVFFNSAAELINWTASILPFYVNIAHLPLEGLRVSEIRAVVVLAHHLRECLVN